MQYCKRIPNELRLRIAAIYSNVWQTSNPCDIRNISSHISINVELQRMARNPTLPLCYLNTLLRIFLDIKKDYILLKPRSIIVRFHSSSCTLFSIPFVNLDRLLSLPLTSKILLPQKRMVVPFKFLPNNQGMIQWRNPSNFACLAPN